jgi:hypothetical protein
LGRVLVRHRHAEVELAALGEDLRKIRSGLEILEFVHVNVMRDAFILWHFSLAEGGQEKLA